MAQTPDWMYRQSAVLPYRLTRGGPKILLITSRKGTRWVLPKGVVEPELTPWDSAAREAWEEAGIEGEVSQRKLGSYGYKRWGGRCQVEVFLMKVNAEHEAWPESDARRRTWLPFDAAAERVDQRKLRKLIRRLPEILKPSSG